MNTFLLAALFAGGQSFSFQCDCPVEFRLFDAEEITPGIFRHRGELHCEEPVYPAIVPPLPSDGLFATGFEGLPPFCPDNPPISGQWLISRDQIQGYFVEDKIFIETPFQLELGENK